MSYPVQQPPPPGYTQQNQTSYVVTTAPVTSTPPSFRDTPVRMQCFACQKDIVTATEYESGTMTWIACLALFGIGFFVLVTWFVCCIPFCISSLKDVRHTCPNCKQELGRYNRMS